MTVWNHDFIELCGLYPNVDLSLLICEKTVCTKNSTVMPTAWCFDDQTSYLIRIQCVCCKNEWMVCKKCKLKKKLVQKRQINSHRWKYHERKGFVGSNETCIIIKSNDEVSLSIKSTDEVSVSTTDITSRSNNADSNSGSHNENIPLETYRIPEKMVLSDSDGYDDDINENINYDMDIFDDKENEIMVKRNHRTGHEVIDPNPPQVTFNESADLMNKQADRYLPQQRNEIKGKRYHRSNVKWTGDEVNDPNPPQVPFKESSNLMNRHAERYLQQPMNLVYHKDSDGGRRTKVVNISFPFNDEYDGYNSSEAEYESPDEDWYYDPRQISKWKWETDFTSVNSDYDSSSTKSDDEVSYKESTGEKSIKMGMHVSRKHGSQFHTINGKLKQDSPEQYMMDNYKSSCCISMLTKRKDDKSPGGRSVARVKQDMYLTQANNLEYYEMNDNTMSYYSHEVLGKGQSYLVARASESRTRSWNDVLNTMSNDEANHECKMAKFVNSLNRTQAIEFAEILSSISKIHIYNDQDLNQPCNSLPTTHAALRTRYLDGRKAINKYLPVPNVKMLVNHSYISINSCIVDFMLKYDESMMTTTDWNDFYNSTAYNANMLNLRNSDKIKSIVDIAMQKKSFNNMKCIPLFMKMWSDDFDPNKSVKSNRQSVWLKTVTIFTFNIEGLIIEHTYPMGLSKKGSDHDELDKQIEIEIQVIKNASPMVSMFSRKYETSVSVYVDYYCIMNDQPERRKNLGLALGNSNYHKRMGYVMDYKQVQNVIRSCERCTKSIFDEFFCIFGKTKKRSKMYYWRTKTCKKCSSFLYDTESKLLHYKPEACYPKVLLPKDGKLRPQRITRDYLEKTIYTLHYGLKIGELKKNDVYNALRCHGLNGDFIDQVVQNASNAQRKINSEVNRKQDPQEYEAIRAHYIQNKLAYKMHRLPCSWFGNNHVKLYVDVPMHLLFLGVMKSAMIKTTRWLNMKRLYTMFLTFTKDVLEPIERMDLDWCKLLKYPSTEKFGGWVSENFLGMSRICTWFYSLLHFLPQTYSYEDPPTDLPLKEWSTNQLRGWLEARKLPKNGKICDMIITIQGHKDKNTEPKIQANTNVLVADLLRMFYSLNKMLSYMMSMNTTKDDIDKLEAIIRMFLISYDMVDKGMSDKPIPSFMSQYNFLCLLNIPETMRQYGSMRNMWEGGIVGEGFLRGMKKELKQGMIGNWQVWTLKNLLETDLYNNLVTNEHLKIKCDYIAELEKECIIHKNEEQASNAYASGQPISGFIVNNDKSKVYLVFREKKSFLCKTLYIDTDSPLESNYQNYYRISIGNAEEEINSINIEDFKNGNTRVIGVLLLPRLNEAGYEKKHENTMYCIIHSEWMNRGDF